MGLFIGHMGGFAIMVAVAALFGVFLYESGIVKDGDKMLSYYKNGCYVIVIGMIYYFLSAFFKNISSSSTNFFDFESIFNFLGIDKVMEQIEQPSINGSIKGLMMPLYPAFTNVLGRLIKEQYLGCALFMNFAVLSAGLACFGQMSKDILGLRTSQALFYVLIIPFSFVLFSPGGYGVVFGLFFLAVYALYLHKTRLYAVLLIIGILMNKLGLLAIIPMFLMNPAFEKSVRNFFEKPILKNPYMVNSIIYVVILVDFLLMYMVIGGML